MILPFLFSYFLGLPVNSILPDAIRSVPLTGLGAGPLVTTVPPVSTTPSSSSATSSYVNTLGPLSPGLYQEPPLATSLILTPTIDPMPPKLVQRIRSGQFVELKELLPDNMALQQQLETIQGHTSLPLLPPSLKPRFREITTPVSWAVCFLTYAAVRTQDIATRVHLVYARLVLQEALRHGGYGWLDYDRLFRRQAVVDPSVLWDSIHLALHSTLILGQRKGAVSFCTLCKGVDHQASQCALAHLEPPPVYSVPADPHHTAVQPRWPESNKRTCRSSNRGMCIYRGVAWAK